MGPLALMLHVKGSPMIGGRGSWLSLKTAFLASIALAIFSWKERLQSTFADCQRYISERPQLHPVLVMASPVLFYLLLVLLARWELDAGGGPGVGRELDWLLQCKRTGLWRLGANTIRGRSTPGPYNAVTIAGAIDPFQAPSSAPAEGLDRLVRQKRCGAWSDSLPTSLPAPLADHDPGEA